MVAFDGERFVDYDIEEALAMKKSVDAGTYEMIQRLTGTDALTRMMGSKPR